MTTYQWAMLIIAVLGFVGTWTLGAIKLGRAVEQIKAEIKQQVDTDKKEILGLVDKLRERFAEDQRAQDHNFGEVGAAMRQYIADVEKKVREVEIFGRDNYVQKGEFARATERFEAAIEKLGDKFEEKLDRIAERIINGRSDPH